MINLGAVNISDKTKELMQKALQEGDIGQGKYIGEFENRLADFLGVKHAIATANGTLADAVALAAIKEKDGFSRDEVIVPALTFIAQINALYYNHLKPVFVDVGRDFQIDAEKIEEKITGKTLAIMPVHLLGKPADMDKIMAIAKKHNLYVLEDSCEALGSKINDKFVGTIGDMGAFSFFVSHSITTGEGGVVVTDNDELAELAISLRNHGRKSDKLEEKFIFPRIGFSAKMNNMEAIIGLGIIDNLSEYIAGRHNNMIKINNALNKKCFEEKENEYIVPHAYPVIVESKKQRDELLKTLPENYGVEARQIFCSIPTQSQAYGFLGEEKGKYPVAEEIGEKGLYVPCHQNLEENDAYNVAAALKEAFKTIMEKDISDILKRVDLEKLRDKTVLITGASGLIGTYLCLSIYYANKEKGLNIRVIGLSKDNLNPSLAKIESDSNFIFKKGNLLADFDFDNFEEKIDYIIHAATYAQPQMFLANKLETIKLNTEATEKLLNLAKKNNAVFMFLSSSETYGQPDEKNIPTSEEYFGNCSTTSQRAPYAESKRLGETLCSVFKETEGVDVKIVRPAMVYGPGISVYDKRVLGNFLNKALLQGHIDLMDQGEQERTWCYISDAIVMLFNVLLNGSSLIYNIGGKETISIKRLAEIICELTGATYSLPEENQTAMFLQSAPDRVKIDISKIEKEFDLGEFVSLEQGLSNVIAWNKKLISEENQNE